VRERHSSIRQTVRMARRAAKLFGLSPLGLDETLIGHADQ
jgi:hypothetical protein